MSLVYKPEVHEYQVDGGIIPSTTQVLKAEGFIDMLDNALDWGDIDDSNKMLYPKFTMN